MNGSDVIAAISTPPGESGIGLVRLSGKGSRQIANKIIKLSAGEKVTALEPNKLSHGFVVDKDTKVDEILVSFLKAPKSYTAEDTIEINCHGGPIALRKTLQLAIMSGARLAEPGEFTKRAFMNGRIDLAQAEAVAEIIKARSNASLRAAVEQAGGRLSKKIAMARARLIDCLANLEAAVDFSDEEPDVIDKKSMAGSLKQINEEIEELALSYEEGRVLREGILTAIIGPPNAGKSSLLNALLKHERAIVTEIPGTTRDLIEESVNIKGTPLVIRDTAGIRRPKDKVEKAGVDLARKSAAQADLVILVIDGSKKNKQAIKNMSKVIKGRKTIVALNKKDLGLKMTTKEVEELLGGPKKVVEISAKLDEGIEELEKSINRMIYGKNISAKDTIVTNLRHFKLLREAGLLIDEALMKLDEQPEEVIALLLKESLEALDGITGKTYQEDLLDSIFKNFCIGK